jgi:hypothetical protein
MPHVWVAHPGKDENPPFALRFNTKCTVLRRRRGQSPMLQRTPVCFGRNLSCAYGDTGLCVENSPNRPRLHCKAIRNATNARNNRYQQGKVENVNFHAFQKAITGDILSVYYIVQIFDAIRFVTETLRSSFAPASAKAMAGKKAPADKLPLPCARQSAQGRGEKYLWGRYPGWRSWTCLPGANFLDPVGVVMMPRFARER